MKLLLIGATGPLGKQLLEQGLAQGHTITALARDTSKIETEHDNLRVVQGDVLHAEGVNAAMEGQEAVLCSLGTGITFHHVTLFSEGTKRILESMSKYGVKRIVAVTGIGAGDSRGHGGFVYDKIIEPTVLRTIYEDKDRQEEILRQSDRDWVVVRPGVLTNGKATGTYRVLLNLEGVTAGSISRADVAAFVLGQLHTNDFLHKFPVLTD